jgi:serine/threonine protein kinase
MPVDAARAKSVFLAASDLTDPAARDAYLVRECGGDAELRARVEALLRANDADPCLADPRPDATSAHNGNGPAQAMDTIDASAAVGSVIAGKYKLLEVIGEGGMGCVYMALQTTPVKRAVAVKVIKAGMDSKAVLARFEAERQALALMDHPNISRVLDAGMIGTEPRTLVSGSEDQPLTNVRGSEIPYFVMELVKGIPITRYCDEHKLTPRQRLELFVPVCQAIQHAHQKGVIHRDIKPSNVLIALYDDKPVPKVIDFGVAKAAGQTLTDRTLMTGFGTVVGTPEYMSPEQANLNNLDVDTRSDVYSLGVLLYELLTGTTPVDRKALGQAALLEILRIVRDVDAPRPSAKLSTIATLPSIAAARGTEADKLPKLMRGELDWVVMKALEKDRARRYDTANALARDIQRYLADELVEARPPSASYRLKKMFRRNKGPVLATAMVLLALVAGVVGTTWGLVEARSERDRAEQEQQSALLERDEKEKARQAEADRAEGERLAKKQAQQRLKQIENANDLLGSIFETLDPREIAKEARPLQAILVEKLDRAVQKLEAEAVGDPLVVAAMQTKLGTSLLALGEPKKAIVVLQKARATRQEKLGRDDPGTLNTMHILATSLADDGKPELALPLHEETLKLRKARLGADDPATLASMSSLADCYLVAGKIALALAQCEQTLKLRKAKLGPEHRETLSSMARLAEAYHQAGKWDLSVPQLEKTLKLQKATLGATHPDTLASMSNLASFYTQAGKLDLALPLLEEALKLSKASNGPDHPDTLESMSGLAEGYLDSGKWDLALQLFEDYTNRTKAKRGPEHPQTLVSMNNLANAYLVTGNVDLAFPLIKQTVKLMKAKLGEHPTTYVGLGNLAHAYMSSGKANLAVPVLEEVLAFRKAKLGRDHPHTLVTMNNLGHAYHDAGNWDRGLSLVQETVQLSRAKLGPDHPHTLGNMHNLASFYRDAGKFDLALPLAEETLERFRAKLGPDHPLTLRSLSCLATIHYRSAKPDLGLSLHQDTLRLRTAKLGPEHPETIASAENLAIVYDRMGDVQAAEPLFEQVAAARLKRSIASLERIRQDRIKTLGAEHAETLGVQFRLADALVKARDFAKAITLYDQICQARSRGLGADHTLTLDAVNSLGVAYWQSGKFDRSIPLYEDLVRRRETKNGRQEEQTQRAIANLGVNYVDAARLAEGIALLEEAHEGSGKKPSLQWVKGALLDAYVRASESAKAIKLLENTIAERRKAMPGESMRLTETLAQSSLTLLELKVYAKAEPLLRECLAIREKYWPELWITFNTRSMLGGALLGQKKYAEAEPLLLSGYQGMKQRTKSIPAQGRARLPEAVDRLIDLYTATNRAGDAKKWKAEREKYRQKQAGE